MVQYHHNMRQRVRLRNSDGSGRGEKRHISATVVRVFTDRTPHHGVKHQHIWISQVEALDNGPDICGDMLVAIRINEGRIREDIPFAVDTPVELQGMLIPADQDNPGLPVLHFTNHPVGFVVYEGEHFE